jgi:hypothetical protein
VRIGNPPQVGNLPHIAVALALTLAVLLVYAQTAHFDFINCDDDAYVYNNLPVRNGLTPASVFWAVFTIDYFYWQPLTWLSHMLDCQIFGLHAGWHHLTNVWIHILNSILVFLVFRRMTGAFWRSVVVAALFALHPLRVESVSWIAERKDVLSGFWLLVTLWTYTRYVERPSSGRYAQVLVAMAMGLAAKPTMVTAPFLLLLLDFWPFQRRAVAEKLPMMMLAFGSMALTAVGQWRFGAMQWSSRIPLTMRMANALVSYARYLGKAVWPRNLAIFYPYPSSIPMWQVAAALALLGTITAVVALRARTDRSWMAGWLWFLVALLPTIGLMQVGRQAMADRFTYIPLLGLIVAVVWGVAAAPRAYWRISAATVAIVACGILSWSQTRTWRDSVTVFEQALKVTPENAFANHDLAVALEARGETDAAIAHYAEAVRIEPEYFIARYNYGSALLARGLKAEAAVQLREAIRYRPDYEDARRKLRDLGQP